MNLSRFIFAVLIFCSSTQFADALCGAGSGGGNGSIPVTTISATKPTGFDISLNSGSYNYTFLPGNPSLWAYLQPTGYVEYTVNARAAGTYAIQLYYASPNSGAGVNLLVNGVQQSPLGLSGTGSWGTLQLSGQATVNLPSGQSVVRIAAQPVFQAFNLAGLLLTPTGTTGPPPTPGPQTNINPNGATQVDVTAAMGSFGYVLYRGNPSLWGNLQPGGYVDYLLNSPTGGNYGLQLLYSAAVSSSASILVNGTQQGAANFPSTGSWGSFVSSSSVTLNLPAGSSTLRIAAPVSFQPYNLSGITLAPAIAGVHSGNYPLAQQHFYINPYSEAQDNINASCSPYYPGSAHSLIQKIAAQPQGVWFGDWNANVQSDAADVMSRAAQQGAVPIMIAYDIPVRDCSGYSGGGAASAGAYRSWIQGLAAGIGAGKAVVILEPDALMQLYAPNCLNPGQQSERLSLLNFAVGTLKTGSPNAIVYIDAGRAGQWEVAPLDMAQRLTYAGVANAAGFSLNVSNYIATDVTTSYGQQISALVGNKHFVIDTSRNGQGPDGDLNWCNPANRGLGAPSQGFNSGLVDGLVWAQNPGTSDGSCNGAPPAGQFSVPIACTLAHNAIF